MTLNQTIARLNLLASNHKQIRQFEFDNVIDWFAGSDLKYPACLVDLNTASISTAEHTTSFPFEIWLADMTNVNADARSNETEVMSDLTSIAEDYLALIQDPAFEDDWTIEGVSQLTYYKEYFTDWVFAIKMTVTISTNYLSDRCQVPVFSDDLVSINNLMIYNYNATGNEGGSFVIGALTGKRVLIVFRGERKYRVVSGIATDSEEIQFITGSGLFVLTNGDELAEGEKIDILYTR